VLKRWEFRLEGEKNGKWSRREKYRERGMMNDGGREK
jgi:hypothetical protein